MSEESGYLLQAIREKLQKQSPDIVRRLELTGDSLSVYDGQMLLRGEVRSDPGYHPSIAHCHVIAVIGNTSLSDPLDACITGIDPDRRAGIAKAATNWVANVGSVLLSALHAKPIMNADHFNGEESWGVPGCHGFVGPLHGYNVSGQTDLTSILNAPLFDYASAMAPAGMIHLAKVVLQSTGADGWNRTLEIDGHKACFEEKGWNCGVSAPAHTLLSRFALFHYGGRTQDIESRRFLEDAIRQFVSAVAATKELDAASQALRDRGFQPDVVHRVAMFAPLAFCRVMFAKVGVKFSADFTRITTEGMCETRKLMSEPAYARSHGLYYELVTGGFADAVKLIAMCSSTFNAMNSALNAGSKPENLVMSSTIIPDPHVDNAAVEQALKRLQNSMPASMGPTRAPKKRWRFWRT